MAPPNMIVVLDQNLNHVDGAEKSVGTGLELHPIEIKLKFQLTRIHTLFFLFVFGFGCIRAATLRHIDANSAAIAKHHRHGHYMAVEASKQLSLVQSPSKKKK